MGRVRETRKRKKNASNVVLWLWIDYQLYTWAPKHIQTVDGPHLTFIHSFKDKQKNENIDK